MSIVKPSFFKNEIYLPHAKGSITDQVLDVESKLQDFIDKYEQEALLLCLGALAIEFFENIDESETSLIKAGSDSKWDELMNGHTYSVDGEDRIWKGIRHTIKPLGSSDAKEPDYSFLAEYVYFFYESNDFIKRADAGNVKVKSANAYVANPSNKVVSAMNRFVRAVQGDINYVRFGYKSGFLGGTYSDYRISGDGVYVSLYQFINDMNYNETDAHYDRFTPKRWQVINQMTI